jgi:RNA polymerase sigma-70 factor, ECF subfamily
VHDERSVRPIPIHSRAHRDPSVGPTDAALVAAARGGDAWARDALFARYARMVHGLAFRLMGRDSDVDDLAQDAFVEALGALDRLQEPAAFSSWLGAIVVRTAHKRLRRRKLLHRLGLRRGEAIDLDALPLNAAPPDVAAELREIYGVLDALAPEERIALVLRRVEGMELREVADRMQLSLATVKRRIAAAESTLDARRGPEGP